MGEMGAEVWEVITFFCEVVMLAKDAAREREIHQSSVLQPRRHQSPNGRPRGRPSRRPGGNFYLKKLLLRNFAIRKKYIYITYFI